MRRRIGMRVLGAAMVLALAASVATAAGGPRYDVPRGFQRCPDARAWNGFFKWASVRHATCRNARAFLRDYGRAAARSDKMPRRVRGFACGLRTWRNQDGDVYASRHTCRRDDALIRFYGMV